MNPAIHAAGNYQHESIYDTYFTTVDISLYLMDTITFQHMNYLTTCEPVVKIHARPYPSLSELIHH